MQSELKGENEKTNLGTVVMSESKQINCMVVRCTTIEREGDEGENGDVEDDSGERGMESGRLRKMYET